ncbi:hypothetical protein JQ575_24515 [Bradyrhizobium sp. JYMT SZCCT0428]|nr:hypothetical protein [Bradyrhizobium sp. JYMT SZCCT0428]
MDKVRLTNRLAELQKPPPAAFQESVARDALVPRPRLSDGNFSSFPKRLSELSNSLRLNKATESIADQDQVAERLSALQIEAEKVPKTEVQALVDRGERAAAQYDLDESATRALIDQQLRDRGWEVDSKALRYAEGSRPVKGHNLAIAEWPTKSGPTDYALFCGLTLVAVVEAKRKRKNVSAAIDQAERYSVGLVESADFVFAGGPWADHRVPFVFATNGRSYLKQIETESGIWFRDTRRAANHRRALVDWPTSDGLGGLLAIDQDAATQALKTLGTVIKGKPSSPAQVFTIVMESMCGYDFNRVLGKTLTVPVDVDDDGRMTTGFCHMIDVNDPKRR